MTAIPVPLRRAVRPRDPHEGGRAATPLELLFDLVFVVAVASNATQLHHGISAGHPETVLGYLLTWFAIWWAWMNYTWFASAYDNDDVVFRLLTFVIMAGALLLAAGVPRLFETGNDPVAVLGYAVMRFGMVGMWLRAAAGHPARRTTALWYAAGIALVQLLWIGRLWAPDGWLVASFLALAVAEISVPFLAEGRHGYTPFHPHHIAERYGLMTIIVLGEVILSTVLAVQQVLPGAAEASGEGGGGAGHLAPFTAAASQGPGWAMGPLVVGGLLVVLSLWWVYFSREQAVLVATPRLQWLFGYGHYLVFAAVAAVGAGLAAAVDVVAGASESSVRAVALALAVAIAVAELTIGVLHAACPDAPLTVAVPGFVVATVCVVVALVVPSVSWAVLVMGAVLAAQVARLVRAPGGEVAT